MIMDALVLLVGDHNRVRGLFAKFNKAKDAEDVAEMTRLADSIITELTVHTTIEEEIFYPATKSLTEETTEDVAEGLEEHKVAKTLMAELQELEPGSETWVAKMTVLIESVEHHAGEEEEELFPEVRSKTDADTRKALAERMEARKAELGAPTVADKIDLTKEQLSTLASEQEIPGRSKMSAEELVAAVAPE
jgi:hemerythrin superfamily protein